MAEYLPTRWRESLERLRRDVQRALERWLPGRRRADADREPDWALWLRAGTDPRIDVEETDDAVRVTAELPGMSERDFSIELSGQRLLLRGERRHEAEEHGAGYYRAERSYGAFAHVVPLPCEVDTEKASARFRNGLLVVTLPKTERARGRRIPVAVRG